VVLAAPAEPIPRCAYSAPGMFSSVQIQLAARHQSSVAGNPYPLSIKATLQFAPTRRALEGTELLAPQTRSPVRGQRAMGGAGHRVFIDTDGRCEVARDEVVVVSWRTDDHALPGQPRQLCQKRPTGTHLSLA